MNPGYKTDNNSDNNTDKNTDNTYNNTYYITATDTNNNTSTDTNDTTDNNTDTDNTNRSKRTLGINADIASINTSFRLALKARRLAYLINKLERKLLNNIGFSGEGSK